MGIGREMRRLCGELVTELTLPVPARPADLYAALCEAMSRRRGRPVLFRTAAFPPGTASGLWLDMADQDLVVVEERTAPDHQLVILGHELWHMKAGHCGHPVAGSGAEVATRLGARPSTTTRCGRRCCGSPRAPGLDLAEEKEAEAFGLLLASKCRTYLAGSSLRGPVQRDHLAGRIGASLGYLGPQS